MATITKNDADRMGAFMREFWPLMKKYWTPDGSEAYWDGLVTDAGDLAEKYLDIQTAKALVMAFLKSKQEEFNEQAAKKTRGQAGAGEG